MADASARFGRRVAGRVGEVMTNGEICFIWTETGPSQVEITDYH
jgi:hypothetical protein